MNAALLLIPFLLIRFTYLSYLNKGAVHRAAHFAPMAGKQIIAYWIYQLSNIAMLISLFFLSLVINNTWQFYTGIILYLFGLILCAVAMRNFAKPSTIGLNQNGIYQLSRNPMYLAYFVFFVGCTLLTQSLYYLALVILFQISAHWIILAEEKWCIDNFGDTYLQYMKKVRRYL